MRVLLCPLCKSNLQLYRGDSDASGRFNSPGVSCSCGFSFTPDCSWVQCPIGQSGWDELQMKADYGIEVIKQQLEVEETHKPTEKSKQRNTDFPETLMGKWTEAAKLHQFNQEGTSHWELADSFEMGCEYAAKIYEAENAKLNLIIDQRSEFLMELQMKNYKLREALKRIANIAFNRDSADPDYWGDIAKAALTSGDNAE